MKRLNPQQSIEQAQEFAQLFRDTHADTLFRKTISLRRYGWIERCPDGRRLRILPVREVKSRIAAFLYSRGIVPTQFLTYRVYLWSVGLDPHFVTVTLQHWTEWQQKRQPARKQLDTLKQLGYTGDVPKTMLHASRIISLIQSLGANMEVAQ